MKNYHETSDGTLIKLKDLSDDHLANIISLIKRRAKQGIEIMHDNRVDFESVWVEEIYGKEVKKLLKYKKYKKERQRRFNETLNNDNYCASYRTKQAD